MSRRRLTNLKLVVILISYITIINLSCDSSTNTFMRSASLEEPARVRQPSTEIKRKYHESQHNACTSDAQSERRNSTASSKTARSLGIIKILSKILANLMASKPVRVAPALPCGLNRASMNPNATIFTNESLSDSTNGIGRYKVDWEQFPFVVFIENKGRDRKFCSGAIVGNRHILTAARCVTDCEGDKTVQNDATKLVGFYKHKRLCMSESSSLLSENWFRFRRVHVPSRYDKCKQSSRHDVALLELDEPIMMRLSDYMGNDSVNRVCLSTQSSFNLPPQMALAIGWSGDSLKELTAIDLSIKLGVACTSLTTGLRNRVICADGQRMPCQFHYGAPIITVQPQSGAMELVGVYSDHYNHCEGNNNIALASSVSFNGAWIQGILSGGGVGGSRHQH